MSEGEESFEVRLRDPLSEVTRRERRNLLGASTIVLGIAVTGLVPTTIPAFGIDLSLADQNGFLWLLAAVVLYFLAAFMIYAASDLVAWLNALRVTVFRETERSIGARDSDSRVSRESVRKEVRLRFGTLLEGPPNRGVAISLVRVVFDLFVPVLIAAYAVVMVFTVDVTKGSTRPGHSKADYADGSRSAK